MQLTSDLSFLPLVELRFNKSITTAFLSHLKLAVFIVVVVVVVYNCVLHK